MPSGVKPASTNPSGDWDGISFRIVTSSDNPYVDKIKTIIATPFDNTIYLDTDTYLAANPDALFQLLDKYEIAVAHAPGYRRQIDPELPCAFYEFNTGVVAYRKSAPVQRFLGAWLATYEAWRKHPPFENAALNGDVADQPAFRRCLWESGLAFYVLGPEYNYRFNFPGFLVEQACILHGRHQYLDRIANVLNKHRGPRVFRSFTTPRFRNVIGRSRATLRHLREIVK